MPVVGAPPLLMSMRQNSSVSTGSEAHRGAGRPAHPSSPIPPQLLPPPASGGGSHAAAPACGRDALLLLPRWAALPAPARCNVGAVAALLLPGVKTVAARG
jgi:hypothetical protein